MKGAEEGKMGWRWHVREWHCARWQLVIWREYDCRTGTRGREAADPIGRRRRSGASADVSASRGYTDGRSVLSCAERELFFVLRILETAKYLQC